LGAVFVEKFKSRILLEILFSIICKKEDRKKDSVIFIQKRKTGCCYHKKAKRRGDVAVVFPKGGGRRGLPFCS